MEDILGIDSHSLGFIPLFRDRKSETPCLAPPLCRLSMPSQNSLYSFQSMLGNTDSCKLLRSLNIVIWGFLLISIANWIDFSSTASFFQQILFTSPHQQASSPSTSRPVRIISLARFNPIIALSRIVPPSIKGTPTFLQNTPNVPPGWDTIKSHQRANSSPPATQYPVTAAIIGFEGKCLVGPIGPLPELLGCHSMINSCSALQ